MKPIELVVIVRAQVIPSAGHGILMGGDWSECEQRFTLSLADLTTMKMEPALAAKLHLSRVFEEVLAHTASDIGERIEGKR